MQISGAPGAGKSTLARALGGLGGAVVLDHDVLKSALTEAGLPPGHGDPVTDPEGLRRAGGHTGAGLAAYRAAFAMAAWLLREGREVILDSPCYYDELLFEGRRVAAAGAARYRYVECVLTDLDLFSARLRARPRLRSQRIAGMRRPVAG